MKQSWMIYTVVAVVSAVAGVAIAGTPDSLSTQSTISVPDTQPPAATVPTTQPAPAPATTSTVTPAPETTTTIAVETTTTTSTLPPIERADVVVVAINGASRSGIATQTRDELVDLGYERARPTDGTDIVDETTVYYFPGDERAAELVALDLAIDPFRNRPVEDAPDFGQLDGDQVAVYIGRDRV